jgi:hypothetical protein
LPTVWNVIEVGIIDVITIKKNYPVRSCRLAVRLGRNRCLPTENSDCGFQSPC